MNAMNAIDTPPAFVAPAPAQSGQSSGVAGSAASPASSLAREARFGQLLRAAQAPEAPAKDDAVKAGKAKANAFKRGAAAGGAAAEINPDAMAWTALPPMLTPALAPKLTPLAAAGVGTAPRHGSVDAADTSRAAGAAPSDTASTNATPPSSHAAKPTASTAAQEGSTPTAQGSARTTDKASAASTPASAGSAPTDSPRTNDPHAPEAASPGNAVPTNAAPTSGDDADATLATAQSQVEAFAKGLQLARQTAHAASPGKAGAALGVGRGQAGAGAAAVSASLAAAEASTALTGSAASHLGAAQATTSGHSKGAFTLADHTADAIDAPARGGDLQASASSSGSAFQPGNGQGFNGSANGNPNGSAESSAASAPTRPTLAPTLGSGTWGLALSQHVIKMVQASQHSAEMQLNPPALGPLKITLSLGDQPLDLRLEATQAEVTQALEAALPQLHRALSEQGITIGQTSVQHGSSSGSFATFSPAPDFSASSFSSGQQGAGGSQPGQRRDPPPSSPTVLANQGATSAARQTTSTPGGLDTYA